MAQERYHSRFINTPLMTACFSQWLAPLALGFILVFSFSPWNIYPLSLLVPGGLFLIWFRQTPLQAAKTGLLFGLGFFGFSVSWAYTFSVQEYITNSSLHAAAIYLIFTLFLSSYFVFLGAITAWAFPRATPSKLILVYPAAWVLTEMLRGKLFTGFPIFLLGYTQAGTYSPLESLIPIIGSYGVSLVLCLLSSLLVASVIYRGKLRAYSLGLLIVIITFSYLSSFISWVTPAGKPIRVSAIQGNTDPANKLIQGSVFYDMFDQHIAMTKQALNSDIIVWPETMIYTPTWALEEELSTLSKLAKSSHTDLLLGAITIQNKKQIHNSMILLGKNTGAYHKQRLFPFAEHNPLKSLSKHINFSLGLPGYSFKPGSNHQKNLNTAQGPILPIICNEIFFSELLFKRLPEAIALITIIDNSSLKHNLIDAQQLQAAQARSLEAGRHQVVASNAGVSALINHRGNIIKKTGRYTIDILTGEVSRMQGLTPFMRWENFPVLAICTLMLLAAFYKKIKQSTFGL